MMARRCSTCGLNWPNATAYMNCGECGESTAVMYHVPQDEVLSDNEAEGIVKRRRFEAYLAKREAPDLEQVDAQIDHSIAPRRQREAARAAERATRQRQFDLIINGAGFTASEINRIKGLEIELRFTGDNKADAIT